MAIRFGHAMDMWQNKLALMISMLTEHPNAHEKQEATRQSRCTFSWAVESDVAGQSVVAVTAPGRVPTKPHSATAS